MANPDHLSRLSAGVSAWNSWRRTNPRERIDLSQAVLHETRTPWEPKTLIEIDLEGVNLRGANLDRTVMKGANLRRADPTLRYANLRRADLTAANLRTAQLNGANLTLACLRDANLTDALFWETVLSRTDLRDAIGLATTKHGGPSIIDHRTIEKSGIVPQEFIRGLGLPDYLIRRYRKNSNSSKYADCFVSYSSADQSFAERLYADLQSHGVRCWYAPKDLPIGAKTRQALTDAIRSNERLIVVLSEYSIGSPWVEKEVETAFEEERSRRTVVLLPVRIDDQVMTSSTAWAADIRSTRNIGNFTLWRTDDMAYRNELNRLLDALKDA
jgi:uncharacterized protein YjbI with pentapeptide repeats